MKNPRVYKALEIRLWSCNVLAKNGEWIPVRPIGWQSLRILKNIKIAWLVFIGKYDALDWEELS